MKVDDMTAIDRILKMDNPVQTYAWGSRTAIAQLTGGKCPSDKPQAEVWMGAHPKAPSKVWHEERWQPLDQLIAQYPQEMLGGPIVEEFDSRLPFLFKILAAGEPLSIQAHPDKDQARDGFRRENLQGIELTASNRNYKDNNHKPECMCAITTFWGLCGFRSLADMMAVIGPVWPPSYNHILTALTQSFTPKGLQTLFQQLMRLDLKPRKELVASVAEKAITLENDHEAYKWVMKLNRQYPGDIGVLSPLLLNIVQLEPGEAIFLPARQLHAYLGGLGVELMANSDNVLRGGLTPKHIDVDELISILDFTPHNPGILERRPEAEGARVYTSQADEFVLAEIVVKGNKPYGIGQPRRGPEIILCIEGTANICKSNDSHSIDMAQGHSVFIPSSVDGYEISGEARLYRAGAN